MVSEFHRKLTASKFRATFPRNKCWHRTILSDHTYSYLFQKLPFLPDVYIIFQIVIFREFYPILNFLFPFLFDWWRGDWINFPYWFESRIYRKRYNIKVHLILIWKKLVFYLYSFEYIYRYYIHYLTFYVLWCSIIHVCYGLQYMK